MAQEIERKFLVKPGTDIASLATSSTEIGQGYLSTEPDRTVRVRIAGERGFITIKSRNEGVVRGEWEYEIPVSDARELIALRGVPSLIKTRYYVPFDGHVWEIDVFHGRHEGLVMAEVELSSADENVVMPSFVSEEVTGNPKYYNSVLVEG